MAVAVFVVSPSMLEVHFCVACTHFAGCLVTCFSCTFFDATLQNHARSSASTFMIAMNVLCIQVCGCHRVSLRGYVAKTQVNMTLTNLSPFRRLKWSLETIDPRDLKATVDGQCETQHESFRLNYQQYQLFHRMLCMTSIIVARAQRPG